MTQGTMGVDLSTNTPRSVSVRELLTQCDAPDRENSGLAQLLKRHEGRSQTFPVLSF